MQHVHVCPKPWILDLSSLSHNKAKRKPSHLHLVACKGFKTLWQVGRQRHKCTKAGFRLCDYSSLLKELLVTLKSDTTLRILQQTIAYLFLHVRLNDDHTLTIDLCIMIMENYY